jgi:hypothetical protein
VVSPNRPLMPVEIHRPQAAPLAGATIA